jgi:MtN3 and saliva related transmembrane protein
MSAVMARIYLIFTFERLKRILYSLLSKRSEPGRRLTVISGIYLNRSRSISTGRVTNYMDAITVLGYSAGALTTLSLLPQVIKIWKSKSANDISPVMFIIFSFGIALWIIYGFAIQSMPVIVANFVSLLLGIIILWLKFRFRRHS